jgi:hypothetical protein
MSRGKSLSTIGSSRDMGLFKGSDESNARQPEAPSLTAESESRPTYHVEPCRCGSTRFLRIEERLDLSVAKKDRGALIGKTVPFTLLVCTGCGRTEWVTGQLALLAQLAVEELNCQPPT